MFSQVVERFQRHFAAFLSIGAVAAIVVTLPDFVLNLGLRGSRIAAGFSNPAQWAATLRQMSAGELTRLAGTVTLAGVFLTLVNWLTGAWAAGTVFSAARDASAGASPDLQRSMGEGSRFFGRFLVYVVLESVTGLVLSLPLLIPLFKWIWVAVLLVAVLVLLPALGYFGQYALVSEDLDAATAYRQALANLRRHPGEHFTAGLILLVAFIAFGLAGLVIRLIFGVTPLLGGLIASIAVAAVSQPFLALYMGTFYLENIRPGTGEP